MALVPRLADWIIIINLRPGAEAVLNALSLREMDGRTLVRLALSEVLLLGVGEHDLVPEIPLVLTVLLP